MHNRMFYPRKYTKIEGRSSLREGGGGGLGEFPDAHIQFHVAETDSTVHLDYLDPFVHRLIPAIPDK